MKQKNGTTLTSRIIFFLLCFSIVFTTLAYGTVHQPILAFFYLISAVVVALWAIEALQTGVLRFNRSLVQVPVLATVAYGLIQVIPFGRLAERGGLTGIPRTISLDPFWTQVSTLHFLALFFMLAALLTFLDSARRLRKIVLLVTIFGFVFAFFAILQSFLSPNRVYGIYEVQGAQPFGSFVNRHNFAAYMEMTIAVPLGLLFVGAVPRDKRLLYITAVGLMGVALLLSGSRGGLVALLAEVFLLALIAGRSKGRGRMGMKIGFAVLLVATIIGGTILIGGESSLTRFADTAASNDITTNRLHIWTVTLDVIRSNLPFGAGLGAFGVAYTPYDTLNGLERVEQAHNDYLQVVADAGLVGLVIGGFFLYWLFKSARQNIRTENLFRRGVAAGALAGCFAILVHSLFDFVLHTTAVAIMFLTMVSLVVVSGREFADDSQYFPRRHKKRQPAQITSIEEIRRIAKT